MDLHSWFWSNSHHHICLKNMSLIIKKNTTFKIPRTASGAPSGIPVAGTDQINIGNSPNNGTYFLGMGEYNGLDGTGYSNYYSVIYFNNSNNTMVYGSYGDSVPVVPYAWNFIYGTNPDNLVVVSSQANTSAGQTAAYIPTTGWPSITVTI